MKKQYKTIIWDLDGTLMDTLQDLMNAVNHSLRLNNMPEHTYEEVRMMVGNGVRKLMERAVPGGESNPLFDKTFADFKAYYVEHCQDNTCLYHGIADTIIELKARGVRMAVVSNKLQAGVTELFHSYVRAAGKQDPLRLLDYMEVGIGERPDVARKPAPDMVAKALQEMGIDGSDAVYVGDSDVDIATAKNSGLPCISVLWGFRDRDFLVAHGAETFVERPEQILDYAIG